MATFQDWFDAMAAKDIDAVMATMHEDLLVVLNEQLLTREEKKEGFFENETMRNVAIGVGVGAAGIAYATRSVSNQLPFSSLCTIKLFLPFVSFSFLSSSSSKMSLARSSSSEATAAPLPAGADLPAAARNAARTDAQAASLPDG